MILRPKILPSIFLLLVAVGYSLEINLFSVGAEFVSVNKWIRATTKETQFDLAVNKAKKASDCVKVLFI